ncbi:hypothetical protein OQY15_04425 [Pedobacter sp. MC2016-15]|uniref:hypothetical protein n=1 Tax=Pedobacter sp. MC2016-15 TaxID=2994473 RepID=UPI002246B66C|nr:hypothetical protein [Pedobacter sp. MC2016-15]MCX2478322.1 hypothetical protein [Pedobacter sp. MC2016-15]
MTYSKTQIGWIMIVFFTLIPLQLTYAYITSGPEHLPTEVYILLMAIMLGALSTFYKLKVTVDHGVIRLRYGLGLLNFRIKPSKIIKVDIINIPLYYGIGIRMTPVGYIYSVNGFKGVRITYQELKSNKEKVVIIGTNDPEGLKSYLAHGSTMF